MIGDVKFSLSWYVSISSLLARKELGYFLLADVTRSCSTRLDLLDGILLKVPIISGRYFDFPKKRQGKKVFPKKLLHSRKCVSYLFFTR